MAVWWPMDAVHRPPDSHFSQKYRNLINDDLRLPIGIVVEPAGLAQWYVDAAVTTIACKGLVSSRVVVGELGPRTIIGSPPRVVEKVATGMIENGIMNGRIRVP